MTPARFQAGCLVLTALNAYATTGYFNYLFFLLRERFGFTDRAQLLVAAMHGAIYIGAAWQCGRFAQRRGNFPSLVVGFAGMAALLVLGALLPGAPAQILLLALWSVAVCFTWPALEAVVSGAGRGPDLARTVGRYNVTWAGAGALAYFSGGALVQWWGDRAWFWLGAGLHGVSLVLAQRLARHEPVAGAAPVDPGGHAAGGALHAIPARLSPATFLRLAWIANPFAYMAINTVLPLIPSLARQLNLSRAEAGVFCSIWLFVRAGAFFTLSHWAGWHYRLGWLVGSFAAMIASVVGILLATQLWVVALAQVVFGLAVGLIYSSSLYYSMDAGDQKGEHGGLHEAMIGIGICAGPGLGAAALAVRPGEPAAGALALTVLLAGGMGWMLRVAWRPFRQVSR